MLFLYIQKAAQMPPPGSEDLIFNQCLKLRLLPYMFKRCKAGREEEKSTTSLGPGSTKRLLNDLKGKLICISELECVPYGNKAPLGRPFPFLYSR